MEEEVFMDNADTFAPEIAVIGMSGRFPGARNLDEFWWNLENGIESITFFSLHELESYGVFGDVYNRPNYVKANGILEDIEKFDASFFGITPRDASIIDPQQRFMLECAWEALENAGYDADTVDGRIGVFAGADMNTYMLQILTGNHGCTYIADLLQLSVPDHLCTRVAYKLNLKGPAVNVTTACSTSLVAVHLACQSLLNGECDMALAGGSSIGVPQHIGYLYREGDISSPDGHCRAFDAAARGTVSSNGIGIAVLKRCEDAAADGDFIYAVIKGSAINNDGSLKVGFTAPSVEGQSAVIDEALAVARVEPESISYIETHGTGTSIGDPIEITGLRKVFGSQTQQRPSCAIGSVKTNIGHTGAAAGIAGFIKTVLSLHHKMIVPHLNFQIPNPGIDLENSPFYVNTTPRQWETNGIPRRAGVSSFGIGGTNAHVVLEEAGNNIPLNKSETGTYQLILLSARTPTALDKITKNLVNYLKKNHSNALLSLADAAYTLKVGRKPLLYRKMAVCASREETINLLSTPDKKVKTFFIEKENPPAIFIFSGQGSQYVNMGKELYQKEKTFRQEMDRCFDILYSISGYNIKEILYPPDVNSGETDLINRTEITQPIVFSLEYALARMLTTWGITPRAMMGYSLGEYTAACLSGVFSLEDALKLVTIRGQLMQKTPPGIMLSVPLPEEDIKPLLTDDLSLAIINGPSCIVSGSAEAVHTFEIQMKEKRLVCMPINIAHAMHSSLMNTIRKEFETQVGRVKLNNPQIPFISNVSGDRISDAEATNPGYWGKHMCSTVRFSDGVKKLITENNAVFIEIGPGKELANIVQYQAHARGKVDQKIVNVIKNQQEKISDDYFLLNKLGELWIYGVSIDWHEFYSAERRYRIPLPTYPFEGRRCWIERGPFPAQNNDMPASIDQEEQTPIPTQTVAKPDDAPRDNLEQKLVTIWQGVLGFDKIGIHDDFYELHGTSLIATQIVSRITQIYPVELTIQQFLQSPTIARLAQVIKELMIEKIKKMSDEDVLKEFS
jgi:acyl transferase domain-containing protein